MESYVQNEIKDSDKIRMIGNGKESYILEEVKDSGKKRKIGYG